MFIFFRKFKSYEDSDKGGSKPSAFAHDKSCGPQLGTGTRLGVAAFSSAIDFFRMYFSLYIVQQICDFTNAYADAPIDEKRSYKWTAITPDEFYHYLSIIIFVGIVPISRLDKLWSKLSIYSFPFPRCLMSFKRFKAINSFLHIVNPNSEGDKQNRLRKVDSLVDQLVASTGESASF